MASSSTSSTSFTSSTSSTINSHFTPITSFNAISPLDGRYHKGSIKELSKYFSEGALVKYRVFVEIRYLLALLPVIAEQREDFPWCEEIQASLATKLNSVADNFSEADFDCIKRYEAETNHDVKAVEYFLKDKMNEFDLIPDKVDDNKKIIAVYCSYIHFAITSQDINNVAIPLMLKDTVDKLYLPTLTKLVNALKEMAKAWIDIPMLARTHGQPATPTRVGKELMVFVERLEFQINKSELATCHCAKFSGATGCFNAHVVAYPDVDWIDFANEFIYSLGLDRLQYTTQIEHYDEMCAIFDWMARINTILIDASRDIWQYISMDYFRQKVVSGQVGSSTMPHKVNPIDFENAEGNFGLANALFGHFSTKLPISRLQRDLSDSTVLRNIGVPIGHTLTSFDSFCRGLSKLEINKEKIEKDLSDNFIVIAEAIQTILRRENVPNAYEILRDFTRTDSRASWDQDKMATFISSLDVPDTVKTELLALSPFTYIGVVPKIK